ncbi:MAG: VWA domain-containing protein, partial [Promethearchaeota archaeon]
LTNTLSESVHDVKGYATLDTPYVELIPSTTPIYNTPTLEPEESVEFTIEARVLDETTSVAVDVLLIIDASGSMGDEISSVQKKLTELIENLSTGIPKLRMGVIVYGWSKYSENPMSRPENQLEFTNDFNAVKNFINSLSATGSYEPWGAALYLANTWDWRANAQKLIIMVGDEDCDPSLVVGGRDGDDFYNGSDLVEVVANLHDRGVVINTIKAIKPGVDLNLENQFNWIAAYTGGESVFLPELEQQGVDLPALIQEWTLEMSREYYKKLNVTITWQDGTGVEYRNTKTEGFWLDFTFPSVVISEKVTPIEINVYSVEIIAEVRDISEISHVTLYHNAYGGWQVVYMTPLPNSSYYFVELTNLPGQYNLTYSIEASDIFNNVGTTSQYWLIVEPTRVVTGEKNTVWVESGDQIVVMYLAKMPQTYYLILSGDEQINSIIVNIVYPGTEQQQPPASYYFQETTTWRKIIPFTHSPADIILNMTIPSDLGDFTFSYVWITLTEVTGENYRGVITEKIRVQGLQWNGINGSSFIVVHNASSPLVVHGEVYFSNWTYIGEFSVIESLLISKNDTYFVLVWAKVRTGEYRISAPFGPPDITDTYHAGDYASAGALWGSSALTAVILTCITLTFFSIIVKRRSKKNL